ncbi:MAG: VPDSG-CTERM sorting domain-containing protein [Chthoniobacterales bacterium]|nr:VPDSG-CTERM sorting domain-containing protein [Chthoniobacterales bacterium]
MHSFWAARYLIALLAVGASSVGHAITINTTDPGVISTFQTGAAIETFDTLSGLSITSYASVAVPAGNQFSSRNLANPNLPAFNSGGATFTNPAANPGTPIGIFDPAGAIAAEFRSANNVAGPLEVGSDQAFGAGFMEVIFLNAVSKVGFWVTHGTVQLILKDTSNTNLASGDFTVTGNQGFFIGIDRGVADIGGITLIGGNVSFTIDDFTSSASTPTATVPDVGSTLSLLGMAFAGLTWCARRRV